MPPGGGPGSGHTAGGRPGLHHHAVDCSLNRAAQIVARDNDGNLRPTGHDHFLFLPASDVSARLAVR